MFDLTFGSQLPFCDSFHKFVGQKNPIIFIFGGNSLVFGAQRSRLLLDKICLSLLKYGRKVSRICQPICGFTAHSVLWFFEEPIHVFRLVTLCRHNVDFTYAFTHVIIQIC